MLGIMALILAVVAYGAFYLGAPGRQSKAVGSPRVLLVAGAVLTVGALAVSIVATQSAVGPVLVLTVMMAVGTVLALAGPFVLPATDEGRARTRKPRAERPVPTGSPGAGLPSAGQLAARPTSSGLPGKSATGTPVAAPPSGASATKPKLPSQLPPSPPSAP